jgi:uncharacterized protein (DUF885 family)
VGPNLPSFIDDWKCPKPPHPFLSAFCLELAACMSQQTSGAAPSPTTATSAASVDTRVATLHKLLDEQWEYTLRNSPEFASVLGDKRYNDRLSDFSQAAIDRDLAAWIASQGPGNSKGE